MGNRLKDLAEAQIGKAAREEVNQCGQYNQVEELRFQIQKLQAENNAQKDEILSLYRIVHANRY